MSVTTHVTQQQELSKQVNKLRSAKLRCKGQLKIAADADAYRVEHECSSPMLPRVNCSWIWIILAVSPLQQAGGVATDGLSTKVRNLCTCMPRRV